MPKKSKDKGARYERKIAKIFGDAFGRKLRRVPLSGGLDIRCDIYDPEDDSFPLYIECKHRESYRIQSILDGTSELYDVYLKSAMLASRSYLTKKYKKGPEPIVVFKGGDFKEDMVMCCLNLQIPPGAVITSNKKPTKIKIKQRFSTMIFSPMRDVCVILLKEFVEHCPKGRMKLEHEVKDEDDGYPD